MSDGNQTFVKEFVLVGFPGLHPDYYNLVAVVLVCVYIWIIGGNVFFLVLFATERTLHKPMYLIIINLVLSDILSSTTILPKIITKYWFQSGAISFTACFVQMHFVYHSGTVNAFILGLMGVDRYAAICYPLRYPAIVTNSLIIILSSLTWVLAKSVPLILIIRAYPLPYCGSNAIIHCFCDHNSITTLACTDRSLYGIPALIIALTVLIVPLTVIIFSYCAIIVAALKVADTQGRLKIISTCSPQLIIIAIYFLPRCFVHLAGNVGIKLSTEARILIVMLYSIFPPMVNPIIYCLRTKDVKNCIIKRFQRSNVNIFKVSVLEGQDPVKHILSQS